MMVDKKWQFGVFACICMRSSISWYRSTVLYMNMYSLHHMCYMYRKRRKLTTSRLRGGNPLFKPKNSFFYNRKIFVLFNVYPLFSNNHNSNYNIIYHIMCLAANSNLEKNETIKEVIRQNVITNSTIVFYFRIISDCFNINMSS